MKRSALVSVVALIAASATAHTAERGEAKASVAGKAVAIDYGRPLLRGRDMLAQAEVGKPWRMGADAATVLKTDADLSFGGKAVPKGTYVLTATKVADGQWQMTVATNDAEKKTVAEVPLTAGKAPASVEQFTIDLKGEKNKGELAMSWGTTVLRTDFAGK
jgi:hypothetical protein